MVTHRGSCLCGAVRYEITGPMRPSVACHCSQCRKSSGHYWSATQVDAGQLAISGDEALRWYRSSAQAERGFCSQCGSSLFWRKDGEARVSVGSGTLDLPTGLHTAKHIFVADKSDYYEIEDGPEQCD
ncbi:GFA family protein [Thioclava sp. BHET1]|nr:GFA family protein [Thioclava sp. BHET1]